VEHGKRVGRKKKRFEEKNTLVRRSERIKMVGQWVPFVLTIKTEPKGKKERKKRKIKLS
jgi:hypothetical protein